MNPNAMAVLEANGLADRVRATARPYLGPRHPRPARAPAGDARLPRRSTPRAASPPGRSSTAHISTSASPRACPPGTVRLGVRVRALREAAGGVAVETEGGETLDGDVLVGADGIDSHGAGRLLRRHRAGPPRLPLASIRRGQSRRARPLHRVPRRGQSVGLVPIGDGQLYVWTTFDSPAGRRAGVAEDAAALRRRFAQFTDGRVRGRVRPARVPERPSSARTSRKCTSLPWVSRPRRAPGRFRPRDVARPRPGRGDGAGGRRGPGRGDRRRERGERGRRRRARPLRAAPARPGRGHRAASRRRIIEPGQLAQPGALLAPESTHHAATAATSSACRPTLDRAPPLATPGARG